MTGCDGVRTPAAVLARAERWRPWRATRRNICGVTTGNHESEPYLS